MNFPTNVKYTKEHEWIRLEGDVAYVGITCGFGLYDFCSRIWKTGFKRNKNRYYCDTICDDLCGGSAFTGMCTGDRSSGKYRRNCDHVGD